MNLCALGAVAAALLCVCVPTAGAAAQWQDETIDALPGGQSGNFDGVYAASDGTAFAVGHRFGSVGGALEFRTWVQRFDGASWHRVNSEDTEGAPAGNTLVGVDGTSPSDVWAVGDWWSGGPHHSLIEHWDGSAFTIVPTPDSAYGESLSAVSARRATDAWAVGAGYQPGIDYGGVALHWDGQTWSRVDVPVPDGCWSRVQLFGVAALGRHRVVAVGSCKTGDLLPVRALVIRWDGTSWHNVGPAQPLQAELYGIASDGPGNVWAVGRVSADGVDRLLLLHFDGSRWRRVRPGLFGYDGIQAHAVSVRDGHVLVVGSRTSTTFGFGPFAAEYDGVSWTSEMPAPSGNLFGVDQSVSGTAWAAGLENNVPSVARRTP
jgi:hypothetical protein